MKKCIPSKSIYKNREGDICPRLCYNGIPIIYSILTTKCPKIGNYLFVIRQNEPNNIYYYTADLNIVMETTNCSTGNKKVVHHNCLANNENVICAGELQFIGSRNVILLNASGHFYPDYECLDYISCLLNDMKYKVLDLQEY